VPKQQLLEAVEIYQTMVIQLQATTSAQAGGSVVRDGRKSAQAEGSVVRNEQTSTQ